MSEMNDARGSRLGARGSEELLAEIDNELRTALAIEPSADFEARVLRTIEQRATARSWWMPSYAFVAAAAAVVITTALAIVMLRPAIDEPPPVSARAGSDVHLANAEPIRPQADPARKTSRSPVVSAFRRTSAAARPSAPEIIVPPNQMETLRRLAVVIEEGRVALAETPEGPVTPPAELVVAPIVVEPLLPPIDPGAKGSTPDIQRPQ